MQERREMSFDELVAHTKMSSYLDFTDQPKVQRSKKHKLTKRAVQKLNARQLELLSDLLDGSAVQVQIDAEPYSVKPTTMGWEVVSLLPGNPQHFVNRELHTVGLCSCEDCRFRHRECKHIRAVRRVAT